MKKILILVLCLVVVVLLALGIWYFQKPQAPAPAWPAFNDSRLGVSLSYPVSFQSGELAEKDAYPQLSYERTISGFLGGARITPQAEAGSYPAVEIFLYKSGGRNLQDWLIVSPYFQQGYANQTETTIGQIKFQKFTGPAGDLVPTFLYLVEAGDYIYQFNINYGLSGAPVKVTAEEILQTIKFQNPQVSAAQTMVKVYFFNDRLAPNNNCKEAVAVRRTIEQTSKIATAAIEELLQGPTAEEKAAGYASAIPAGSKLNSLAMVGGEARADFNAATESGGGSCSMAMRTEQITETLKQFSTVKIIRLSVDGRTGDIFQP